MSSVQERAVVGLDHADARSRDPGELDPDPPGWPKRGSGVSWGYKLTMRGASPWGKTTHLAHAIIEEISVLSPSRTPREALARVAWVGEIPDSSAAIPTSDRAAAGGEVCYGGPTITPYGIGQGSRGCGESLPPSTYVSVTDCG